jgi:hypothetical protein
LLYLGNRVRLSGAEQLFLQPLMTRATQYNIRNVCAVLLMLASLAWLTISLPYVNGAQMKAKAASSQAGEKSPEDNQTPLSNAIEEKNESAPVSVSEFLHNEDSLASFEPTLVNFYKCHPSDLYFAFHPELISPPPELLS